LAEALRTPDNRFQRLPGWTYEPSYHQRPDGLRLHYADIGADTGPPTTRRTWLCLHGQPTWSYLYRRMMPAFAANGRVIAPDFLGFGRSDKPAEDGALVVQDWGGLIGLTLPMAMPERFEALLVMNTMLGTGDEPLGQGFLDWRAFSNKNPDMDIARLMKRACPHLSDAEAAAYAAPYPDASYKAGVRAFPNLVPDRPDAPGAALSRQARDFWRNAWTGRSLMAIGMKDPVLGPPVMRALHANIRNCPQPLEIAEGGHFLQEWGESIARIACDTL
jgi:haloalkane dehalogenase/tRNA(adenine34) deaminase